MRKSDRTIYYRQTENILAVDVRYVVCLEKMPQEIPEGIVFRIAKEKTARRMKSINCPHCGRHFTNVELTAKVNIFKCTQGGLKSLHEIRACHYCHTKVGVIFK